MFKKIEKTYRLGIDMGSTSLGWCMLELDDNKEPVGIINMGVRIFPDGRDAKTKEPLSVSRRSYRSQRRNLDRYLLRQKDLIKYLLANGFLPEDAKQRTELFVQNPYMLRAKALDEELKPGEFARAVIHLSKRRGFKSNRKIMSDKKTAYTEAIENLKKGLENSDTRSLGEYLWNRYQETPEKKGHLRKPIIFRYEKKSEYPEPIFPLREMAVHEFDAIWDAQAKYNIIFTEEHRQALKDIIFRQRELKPQPKGKCQLIPTEDRAPKAHPLFQEFRIRQDLNNLKLIDMFDNSTRELTDEQYNLLYDALTTRKEVPFESMRRLILAKEAGDYRFNLETESRKKLLGNLTYCEIHSKEHNDIAPLWDGWGQALQNKVIEIVVSDLDDEPSKIELMELGITENVAERLLQMHFPADYCNLSLKAMNLILPHMRERAMFSVACELAGIKHSLEYDGRVFDEGNLPYYGELLKRETLALSRKTGDLDADEFGRINNPTVHIALNQLRKVINALCERYGAPQEIILELGKEIKLGMAEKERLEKQMNKNRKLNEKVDEFLASMDIVPNHVNRLKAKLWFELGDTEIDRRCIYTGHQISVADLFSDRVEVDHILPKSRTYDDSTANKILCIREANRYKAERSPFEAFGDSSDGYSWNDIVSRSNCLPENKKRRFQKDSMQRYEDKNELLARMLNDTRYMSRVAMKYLYYICGDKHVSCITGLHTGLLRSKWGLNSALGDDNAKNRFDHRHHAIDSFVISLTTRSMIMKMANNIENSRTRFIENLEPPFSAFEHEQFKQIVASINVSYKPDHIDTGKLQTRNQTGGSLLEETAYHYTGTDPDNPKMSLYDVRKKITDIGIKNIDDIASPQIRKAIMELKSLYPEEKSFKLQLAQWAINNNVKKVKMIITANPDSMIPILDKSGKAFKYHPTGDNLFADIYIKDPTKQVIKWDIEIVSSYHAHQPDFIPRWKKDYPKAKKVMRVFKNDVIAIDCDSGGREYRRVKKMSDGNLFLREINIAKKDKTLEDIGEKKSVNQLMLKRARKAGVDILGRVFDPIVNES